MHSKWIHHATPKKTHQTWCFFSLCVPCGSSWHLITWITWEEIIHRQDVHCLVWGWVSKDIFCIIIIIILKSTLRTVLQTEKTDQFQTNYCHEHRDWVMLREDVILLTWGLSVAGGRRRSHLAPENRLTKVTMGLLCELCLEYIMTARGVKIQPHMWAEPKQG